MPVQTKARDGGPAGIWPWPGTGFLVAAIVWLGYMGWATAAPDVADAFRGMSVVLIVVLLFALRAAVAARSASRAQAPVPARARRTRGEPAGETAGDEDGEAASPEEARPAVVAMAPRRGYGAGPRRMVEVAAPIVPGTGRLRPDEVTGALRSLEGLIRSEGDERRNALADLHEALSERIDDLAEQVDGVPSAKNRESDDAFLRVEAFNNAVRNRLLPHIEGLIEERLRQAGRHEAGGADSAPVPQDITALHEEVVTARAELESADDAARQERAAMRKELRGVREIAEKAARLAAAQDESTGPAATLFATQREHAKELAALKAALTVPVAAGAGDAAKTGESDGTPGWSAARARFQALYRRVEDIDERTSRRFTDLARLAEQQRDNQAQLVDHLRRMGETYRDLSERLRALRKELAAHPVTAGKESEVEAVAADVDQLRNALTTIMEQNQKIKEQQDLLTARFDAPTHVKLKPEE